MPLETLESTQEAGVALATLRETLKGIYTVRLCRMRQAYGRPTTRIVPCESNLQLANDCRVRHKKIRTYRQC